MTDLPVAAVRWADPLGWTLVQFLWQGTVIAGVFALARAAFGGWLSSHARYLMACAALVAMVAAPVVTFTAGAGLALEAPGRWLLPATSQWHRWMPVVVTCWMLGVLACLARLCGGWLTVRRLATKGLCAVQPEWAKRFDALRRRLDITWPVRVCISSRVDVPIVVGWLRPMVLVPIGAMTGLPSQYVEVLLTHELAHVRRRDYLVNLLQRAAEAMLFYHPAIWWVSEQIRVEREACCDDIVVAMHGDALMYARALTALESSRCAAHQLQVAANGPSLLHRIRRLLGQSISPWQMMPGPAAVAAIVALWFIGIGVVAARGTSPSLPPRVARTESVPVARDAASSSLITTALLGPVGSAGAVQTPPAGSRTPGLPDSLTPPMPTVAARDRAFAKGTGIIRGRVFRMDTNQPVRQARVSLRGSGLSVPPVAVTNDEGRYELRELPVGRFTVVAAKDGFVKWEYGQRTAGESGQPVELSDGQVAERIDVSLPSGAVFSGQVLDEAGEPQSGVIVQAFRQQFVDNLPVPGPPIGLADASDDQGQFRIFGLPAGDYFLGAMIAAPGNSSLFSLNLGLNASKAKTLYPGTRRPREATPLHLDAGQEIAGLSFAVSSREGFRITGFLRAADGSVPADATLSVTQGTMSGGRSFQGVTVRPDGSFSTPELAPGEYSLVGSLRSSKDTIATVPVVIDEADIVANLTLKRGDALRGRVMFDANANRGALKASDVRLMIDGQSSTIASMFTSITIQDDWTFEVTGLSGPLRLWTRLPSGWTVKSIRLSGRDVTDTTIDVAGQDVDGVEVTLTQRVTTVSGFVSEANGKRVSDASVIVLADDPEKWMPRSRFIQRGRPDSSGRFVIQGLPAGSYVAVAVKTLPPDAEANPLALDRLRRIGTHLTLKDGESRTADLHIVSAP
jgi:beta-lactamase regulating signal transducer with metallopeptidase domain